MTKQKAERAKKIPEPIKVRVDDAVQELSRMANSVRTLNAMTEATAHAYADQRKAREEKFISIIRNTLRGFLSDLESPILEAIYNAWVNGMTTDDPLTVALLACELNNAKKALKLTGQLCELEDQIFVNLIVAAVPDICPELAADAEEEDQ